MGIALWSLAAVAFAATMVNPRGCSDERELGTVSEQWLAEQRPNDRALFGTVTSVNSLAVLDWTAQFSPISHTAVHDPFSYQPVGHLPARAAAGPARVA